MRIERGQGYGCDAPLVREKTVGGVRSHQAVRVGEGRL